MAITLASVEEQYRKNTELTEDAVKLMRDWLSKQPHMPQVTDLDIVLFLHCCFYSTERAKYTMDTYYTVRTHVPEFFANRNPAHETMTSAMSNLYVGALPKKTPKDEKVFFVKLYDTNPSNFVLANVLKVFTCVVDLELNENGTASGHRIVMDMDGVQFGHVARLGIMTVKKYLFYLQEAKPIRLTGLHFINVVPFMDKILAIMRPFMKPELMQKLLLHTDDLTEFHKFVPKDILPKDYGGDAPLLIDMKKSTTDKINANKTYFIEEEKLRVDESRRPGKAKSAGDLFGVEGSFKKLDID